MNIVPPIVAMKIAFETTVSIRQKNTKQPKTIVIRRTVFFSHTDDSDGDVAGQVAVKNGRTEYPAAGGDRCTYRIPHGKRKGRESLFTNDIYTTFRLNSLAFQ